MTTPSRRPRRSSTEVHELILRTARGLFAQHGYDGTSLRDISKASGVTDSVVYRNVGTKAEIFQRSVLDPYHEFTEKFLLNWRTGTDLSNADMINRFTLELYNFLSDNRELILALVAANAFSSAPVHPSTGSQLSEQLEEVTHLAESEADWRGFSHIDIPVATRCVVGLVMSMVLLDDWLFPTDDRRPSRQRIIHELQHFGLGGLQRNTR